MADVEQEQEPTIIFRANVQYVFDGRKTATFTTNISTGDVRTISTVAEVNGKAPRADDVIPMWLQHPERHADLIKPMIGKPSVPQRRKSEEGAPKSLAPKV